MKRELSDRTRYSMRNASIAMATKILAIVFGFFSRMMFTHTLTMQYAGINGLFTNIVGALNMADLGISTALVYSIYEPVARRDIPKQQALMKLFERIYIIIAGITLILGVMMFPVLRTIMNDANEVQGVMLIYALFLARTVFSYFMMYRSMIFIANQRNYVNDVADSACLVAQNTIQMIILYLTGNYILYLIIYVVMVLVRNICIYFRAEHDYPEVFQKNVNVLSREEEKGIFRNMRAMLMHKIGTVVINNIDNLTLTGIVGIISVGMYSNYYLIIGSIRQIMDRIVNAIAGSVGNLGAIEHRDSVREVFLGTLFVVAAGYGTAAIGLYEILDMFVGASFGSNYVFPKIVTMVLCLNLFLNGIRQASLIFRDSLVLFWHDRYKTIIESIVNLVFSVILARRFGAAGVFIGTTVSIVGISMWVEPMVLYKDFFKVPVKEYFLRSGKYCTQFFAAWFITDRLIQMISWNSDITRYFGIIIICMIIPPLFLVALNGRSEEMCIVLSHLNLMGKGTADE